MAHSVVCPECGSPVARGRLSCISCGTLLAAVAGGPRRAVVASAGAAAVPTGAPPTSPAPAELEAGPDAGPAPATSTDRPVLAPSATFATGGARPVPSSSPTWPAAPAGPTASAFPPASPPDSAAVPGVAAGPNGRAPGGAEAPDQGRSPVSTALDRLPRELPSGMALVGSALAIASFLLPFATDGVLGTSGIGYFGNWGFGNPGYLLLVLAALAVVAVDLFPERSPAWIRSGLLPLLVGAVLLGVAFTYFARPFGGGTGVTVLLLGAIVMLGGGLVGLVVERHATPPPSV